MSFNVGDPVRLKSTVVKYSASPGPNLIEREHPNYYVPAEFDVLEDEIQHGTIKPADTPVSEDWDGGALTYVDAHPGKVIAISSSGIYRIRLYYPVLRS